MSSNEPRDSTGAERPGLARADTLSRIDSDLDRVISDQLLARADMGDALARDFEASMSMMLPSPSDIDRALLQASDMAPSAPQEIESLLSLDRVGDVAVEGLQLNDLLQREGLSIHERTTLNKGLLFLRRKLYSEAADWWTLNRPKDALADPRAYCVLSIMLAFTYHLSGQTDLAKAAAQEAHQARKLI